MRNLVVLVQPPITLCVPSRRVVIHSEEHYFFDYNTLFSPLCGGSWWEYESNTNDAGMRSLTRHISVV